MICGFYFVRKFPLSHSVFVQKYADAKTNIVKLLSVKPFPIVHVELVDGAELIFAFFDF